MMISRPSVSTVLFLVICAALVPACEKPHAIQPSDGVDADVQKRGTIEVTARLLEVPDGAIVRRELYDYATVLKYEVIATHRGTVADKVIYVAHYNPLKARRDAPDRRVKEIGGDLTSFNGGDVHRMALEPSMDDQYMGAVINTYHGTVMPEPYWAVWTNLVRE